MQSGSLPTWVTIVVAVLGIVGLVIAQLVNAWREDRRMKNDREREDLRWLREAADRQAQRDHDARLHWTERRLDAYAAVIEAFQEWEENVFHALHVVLLAGPDAPGPANLPSAHTALGEAIARVRLVGSPEADAKVGEVHELSEKLWPFIYGYGVDVDSIRGLRAEFDLAGKGLKETFRADLGVTSPPSDQAS